jgi:hypothetical protein
VFFSCECSQLSCSGIYLVLEVCEGHSAIANIPVRSATAFELGMDPEWKSFWHLGQCNSVQLSSSREPWSASGYRDQRFRRFGNYCDRSPSGQSAIPWIHMFTKAFRTEGSRRAIFLHKKQNTTFPTNWQNAENRFILLETKLKKA